MRIAINGFGRIGRSVFRILNGMQGVEVVAINDITDNDALAYLLKHDTVMGPFPGTIAVEGDTLRTRHQVVKMTEIPNPAELPWGELGVDFVIESTGRFRKRSEIEQHLSAGARKVVLTVPAKDEIDCTVVLGVNEGDLKPEHKIVSNASCTTNCLAPICHVLLKEGFGIEEGLMTTIHSYTATQKTVDGPSKKDWKGGRSAAINIIPSATGAAKAVGLAIPEIKGKLTGMAFRVPTPTVSAVDLTVKTVKETSYAEISAAMKKASETYLKGVLSWTSDEVVSTDFIHDQSSSIFDAGSGIELNSKFFKLVSWYDNEWGYSNRVVDLVKYIVSKGL